MCAVLDGIPMRSSGEIGASDLSGGIKTKKHLTFGVKCVILSAVTISGRQSTPELTTGEIIMFEQHCMQCGEYGELNFDGDCDACVMENDERQIAELEARYSAEHYAYADKDAFWQQGYNL